MRVCLCVCVQSNIFKTYYWQYSSNILHTGYSLFAQKANHFRRGSSKPHTDIRNGISSRNEYFLTTDSCLQWDLVCDKDSYVEITQTLFNVGIVIGFFLFTPFADRYGRKKVLFTCHFFMDVFGIVLAFSPDLISFCVCQFLTGMCAAVSTFILSWARAPLVVYSVVRWLVNRD